MNPRQNAKRHNFTGQNATKGCNSKKNKKVRTVALNIVLPSP